MQKTNIFAIIYRYLSSYNFFINLAQQNLQDSFKIFLIDPVFGADWGIPLGLKHLLGLEQHYYDFETKIQRYISGNIEIIVLPLLVDCDCANYADNLFLYINEILNKNGFVFFMDVIGAEASAAFNHLVRHRVNIEERLNRTFFYLDQISLRYFNFPNTEVL